MERKIKMAKVISWTNNFSGEKGYVKKISMAKGYFENTFVKEEARKFASDKQVQNALNQLTELKEDENNTFSAEEI